MEDYMYKAVDLIKGFFNWFYVKNLFCIGIISLFAAASGAKADLLVGADETLDSGGRCAPF
ncbi:MAG: hypothetical protein ACRENO_10365 [Thermodesulfobacteriota bacterium]